MARLIMLTVMYKHVAAPVFGMMWAVEERLVEH